MATTQLPQIIALGGGGFSMEPDNPALDRYVCEATGKERPQVCYLAQAGGENYQFITRFYSAFANLDARPSHLSLFQPHTADLAGFLLGQDAIYVGGGNTKSMLALWREWGVDGILRQAWGQGIVLAGISAGAICWFAQGLTDSIPGAYTGLPCLGFLPTSCSPHFDGEAERRPTYQRLVGSGQMKAGYGIDDFAALHFVGEKLERVVASQPQAAAQWIEADGNGGVNETRLEALFLGDK
ncbi:MAG: peptidase E [Caldilineaceae bacterium]|nr:peptidase E [Caldilineaceae bacterium]